MNNDDERDHAEEAHEHERIARESWEETASDWLVEAFRQVVVDQVKRLTSAGVPLQPAVSIVVAAVPGACAQLGRSVTRSRII